MNRRATDFLFRVGLIFKGLDASLEVIGGLILLSPIAVNRLILRISQHELYANLHHVTLAKLERATVHELQAATLASALYLIAHGASKVVLIIAIFKDRRWGYIGLFAVMSFFTLFELSRFIVRHSWGMLAVATFDGLILYLIAKEFRMHFRSAQSLTTEEASEGA